MGISAEEVLPAKADYAAKVTVTIELEGAWIQELGEGRLCPTKDEVKYNVRLSVDTSKVTVKTEPLA